MIDALRHSAAHVFVDSPASPVLSNDDQHHLERVLRLRNGESVTCSNGNGEWSLCEWRDSSLFVTSDVQVETRHEPVLTVAIAPV
ncbi:MAG: RNA methyltransferase PUA domain-containing protein, partial [Actinomycetes bacterium]